MQKFKTLRIFHKMICRSKKKFHLLWIFFLVTLGNFCELLLFYYLNPALPKIFFTYNHLISLSKMAHQMWHDHSFSQRNKTTEISVVVVVGDREASFGVGQNLKNRRVGNIGGLHKIGGLGPLWLIRVILRKYCLVYSN